jgi:hypothetical protein
MTFIYASIGGNDREATGTSRAIQSQGIELTADH